MDSRPNRRWAKNSRVRKTSTSEDKGRPFKVPCLTKFEDLKRKFANVIEINWRGLDKRLDAESGAKSTNNNVPSNHRSSVISKGVKNEDELNITRRDRLHSRLSNSVDSLDEIQFRASNQVKLKVKRTPKIRTSEPVDDSDEESANRPKSKRTSRPKANTNATSNKVKGPRSRTQGPRAKESVKVNTGGRVRQQAGRVHGHYVYNGYRIKNPDVIDTQGFVDDGMICFLPELCHRAQIQPLGDPLELVARSKFKIELEEFQVPKEVEEESEIECVDMTED